MKKISMIVAMDENRGIGKNNGLIWRLKRDLQHFKETTLNKPLVMGRKTYESIGRPLPNRRNIVLSRDPDLKIEGVEVMHSVDEVLAIDAPEIMIGGGAEIYKLFMPHVNQLYLTEVKANYDADAFFPELEGDWQEISRESFSKDDDNEADFDMVTFLSV